MNGLLDGRRDVEYSGISVGDGGSDMLVDGGVGMSLDMADGWMAWLGSNAVMIHAKMNGLCDSLSR